MSATENPSAFPFPEIRGFDGCGIREGSDGMTLRDWFAGQVLVGELSGEDMGDGPVQSRSDANATLMARRAYHLADAMLAERMKVRS